MFRIAEDVITRKNWNWRDNPIRIKKNQVWKKRDSGNIVVITAVASDHVVTQQPRKKKCHHLTKKDLLMFWNKIS